MSWSDEKMDGDCTFLPRGAIDALIRAIDERAPVFLPFRSTWQYLRSGLAECTLRKRGECILDTSYPDAFSPYASGYARSIHQIIRELVSNSFDPEAIPGWVNASPVFDAAAYDAFIETMRYPSAEWLAMSRDLLNLALYPRIYLSYASYYTDFFKGVKKIGEEYFYTKNGALSPRYGYSDNVAIITLDELAALIPATDAEIVSKAGYLAWVYEHLAESISGYGVGTSPDFGCADAFGNKWVWEDDSFLGIDTNNVKSCRRVSHARFTGPTLASAVPARFQVRAMPVYERGYSDIDWELKSTIPAAVQELSFSAGVIDIASPAEYIEPPGMVEYRTIEKMGVMSQSAAPYLTGLYVTPETYGNPQYEYKPMEQLT